ncbi:MAG: amidohydrolase family protein [Bryobacteraceae bacterium]|nr:amidohydrolase family protein [Bryobacteraceae bacterium]
MRIAAFLLAAALLSAGENDSFLIRNATVHPVSGPKLNNASVLVMDGKIAEVGERLQTRAKVKVIDGRGLHVYPGMIDAATLVGISEISSVRETADISEVGEFNPQLRSSIAVNPESEHIPVTRANGITAVGVLAAGVSGGFGFGEISYIGGQISLMHLDGWTWEEMTITHGAAMQLRLPGIETRRFNPATRESAATPFSEARRRQETNLRKVKTFFEEARRYQTAKQASPATLKTDLRYEAMLPVLEGKLPLLIPAAREREIRDALAFAEQEKVKIILVGVRRPGGAIEEIAKRKIPVILGSPFVPIQEEDDPYDATFTLAADLHRAGVKIAFASLGAQFARNLPYQAGHSVAYGLPYDAALRSVTLNAAEIYGVADRIGSIDSGKYADLIVTDGDPLEIRTQVKMMFVKGEPVDLESKHTRLYKKYRARP